MNDHKCLNQTLCDECGCCEHTPPNKPCYCTDPDCGCFIFRGVTLP